MVRLLEFWAMAVWFDCWNCPQGLGIIPQLDCCSCNRACVRKKIPCDFFWGMSVLPNLKWCRLHCNSNPISHFPFSFSHASCGSRHEIIEKCFVQQKWISFSIIFSWRLCISWMAYEFHCSLLNPIPLDVICGLQLITHFSSNAHIHTFCTHSPIIQILNMGFKMVILLHGFLAFSCVYSMKMKGIETKLKSEQLQVGSKVKVRRTKPSVLI